MPPIAAFDVDLTIHRTGLFILLMEALVERGHLPRELCEHPIVCEYRERVRRGLERDYAYTIVDQFHLLGSAKGLRQDVMIQVAEELLELHGDHTWLFPRLLLETAKEQGYVTVAISGSPTEIVRPFVRRWGFDDCLGTELPLDDHGCFTGDDEKVVRHFKDKAGSLERLAAKHGCTLDGSIAIGDSRDDLPMLRKVSYPFAMNPSNEVREQCRMLNIPLIAEYGDSIHVLRVSGNGRGFVETDMTDILPFPFAERLLEKAQGRIGRPGRAIDNAIELQ